MVEYGGSRNAWNEPEDSGAFAEDAPYQGNWQHNNWESSFRNQKSSWQQNDDFPDEEPQGYRYWNGQSAPYQQSYAPYPPYGYQAPYVSKDHVAAGLLAIFLGGLGIHKFYLGYNTPGFIMLAISVLGSIFTLGIAAAIMGLIGFIEGIIYLTKTQTEFEQTYMFRKREWF